MPTDPADASPFTTLAHGLRRGMRNLFANLFPSVVAAPEGDGRRPKQRTKDRAASKAFALRKVLVQYAATLLIIAGLGYGMAATYVLTGDEYTQTFDGVGTALPEGFAVWTGASDAGLGNGANFNLNAAAWNASTGQFANFASADGLTATTSTADQAAATDRVIGVRQTGSFGDPGAGISFNFDASAATFSGTDTALALTLQMLSVQTRSTVWSIQYGIGSSPSSFTTLGTYSDPGVFGATMLTFTGDDLAAFSGLSNVYLRIVALGVTSGSGSRDTIALDDLTLSYTAIAAPPPTGYFWIGNDLTLGGAGTWDQNTTPSWSVNNTTIVATNWNNTTQAANFGGTGGAITVSGTVEAGAGLVFTADAYSLTGGAIHLVGATAAANSISVNTGSATTIGTALTGTNGVSKGGPGALLLTGNNSGLTGGITLNAGTLSVGSATALGAAGGNALSLNGGTLTSSSTTALTIPNAVTFGGDVGLGAASTGNVELSGPIGFAAGTRTLSVGTGVALKISGTTSDGGFIKAGAGSLEFPVSNSLTSFGISAGSAVIPAGVTLTTTTSPLSSTGGALTINGTLRSTGTGTAGIWLTPLGTVTVAAEATVIQQGAASATNFLFAANTTWEPGSTFIFRDFTGTPAASNRTYRMNVIFDSTGEEIFVGAISGGSPLTINGDLTIGENVHFLFGSGFTSTTSFLGNVTVNGYLGFDGGARSFMVNTGKVLSIGADGALDIQGGEILTVNGSATVNGTIGGTGSVVINGGGTVVVSGSITAATGTTVGNTGTLRGAAAVTLLTVASGGTVAPGDGPGTMTVEEGAIFQGGGTYQFELNSDGTGAAGTNWDRLAIAGTLDLTGLSAGSPFVLQLQTLTAGGANGNLAAWDSSVDHTWFDIVTTTAGFVAGTFDSSRFTVDSSGFANAFGGTFSVVANGNNLDLQYLSIPEPSALLSLVGGIGMIALLRPRNRDARRGAPAPDTWDHPPASAVAKPARARSLWS